jgi:hypothetical protein
MDLCTVMCPHIQSTFEMPRLHQLVLDEYVKYGLHDFDLETQKNTTVSPEEVGSLVKKQKTGHGGSRIDLRPDAHRPLSIGLTTGDAPPGFGWGSESEEEGDAVVVLQTPEVRQLREKKLQTESVVALKKWRLYDRQLDWAPFLKSVDVPQQKSAVLSLTVVPKSTMNAPSPVGITSKSVTVDLLEADFLELYRQVLAEEEVQVKVGDKAQFGDLPRMDLSNIGAMNWINYFSLLKSSTCL